MSDDLRNSALARGTGSQQDASASAWISVDDARKPVGRTPILVAVACIKFGEYDDGTPSEHRSVEVNEGEYIPLHGATGDYFTSYCTPQADQEWVTHWMPLPAPPAFPRGPVPRMGGHGEQE